MVHVLLPGAMTVLPAGGREPAEHDLDELAAVGRVLQGETELGIGDGREVEVEARLMQAVARDGRGLQVLVSRQPLGLLRVHRPADHVCLAALQHGELILDIGDHQPDHAIDVRRQEEFLVRLEVEVLALPPLLQPKAAVPDRLVIRVIGRGFHAAPRHPFPDVTRSDECESKNVRHEGGRSLLEVKAHLPGRGDLDPLHAVAHPGERRELPLEDVVERELHVLYRDGLAVVEGHAVPQHDVHGLRVDDRPGGGGPGLQAPVGRPNHESRVHPTKRRRVVDLRRRERVQRHEIVDVRNPDGLAAGQRLHLEVGPRDVGHGDAGPGDLHQIGEARLVIGLGRVPVHQDEGRVLLRQEGLGLQHERSPLLRIHLGALRVGELVEFGVVEIPVVQAALDQPAGVEELGQEVIGIEPVRRAAPRDRGDVRRLMLADDLGHHALERALLQLDREGRAGSSCG